MWKNYEKIIALLLAMVMCLALFACRDNKAPAETNEAADNPNASSETESESSVLTKDEMLSSAKPLTKDEINKSIDNIAFAKSLVGNIYTFIGEVFSVKEDHAVVTLHTDNYGTAANVMVADLYLPLDDLISFEDGQRFSFVGKLDDAGTHVETFPGLGSQTVIVMTFKNVAIVSDRFEETGTLHSPNASFGKDAWNIKFPGNSYLSVVHFRDDVRPHEGEEITYSYKITADGYIDAYIVE